MQAWLDLSPGFMELGNAGKITFLSRELLNSYSVSQIGCGRLLLPELLAVCSHSVRGEGG